MNLYDVMMLMMMMICV